VTPSHGTTGTAGRRLIRCLPLCLAFCLLAGCLLDATLNPAGGGTMTIRYRLTNQAQLESAKKRVQSPRVKLVSAEVDAAKWATFKIQFDDVEALSTIEFFENTTFSLAKDGRVRKLEVKFVNKNPSELPDEMAAYMGKTFTVSLHLPGKILDSNATKTEGNTATWSYELKKFTVLPRTEVRVTYDLAAQIESPADATPNTTAAAPVS